MYTKAPITSSELGTLWMTYQKKKMLLKMMEYFIGTTDDEQAKNIISFYQNENNKFVAEIEGIFNSEGAAIPVAFVEGDVNKDAPPLYDKMFPILFLRLMMKMSSGFNTVHLNMSYRKDIIDFFIRSSANAKNTYGLCTQYLLEKGVLARPPYVTMPKKTEFVDNNSYLKGIRLFGDKRSLNTIEAAYLYQAMESNNRGMQLMTGFAQVAKESDARDYFIKGKELAKKIISTLSDIFLQSDIQPPNAWSGRPTDSTVPPFSDKIMMYCTSLLSSFGLGSNALGTTFSLRSDLPIKLSVILKDTFDFASEGGQIMIKHHWMEEPPQMEDRNQLTKSK